MKWIGGIIGGALAVGVTPLFPGQWALFYGLMGFAGWFLGYFAGAMVQEYRDSRASCPDPSPKPSKVGEHTPNFCARNGARLTLRELPAGFDEKDGHELYSRWLACIDWHGTTKYKRMDPTSYGLRIARTVSCEGTFTEARWSTGSLYGQVDYLDCAPEYVYPEPAKRKAAAK